MAEAEGEYGTGQIAAQNLNSQSQLSLESGGVVGTNARASQEGAINPMTMAGSVEKPTATDDVSAAEK